MAHIECNFDKTLGAVKAMHAIGQPPMLGINDEYFSYISNASMPYSRLHDVGGAYGGNVFVDIPNIFRDFDADETLPESYDFAFTDVLIASLMKHNCEPIYRLGVTIENNHHIKAYNIYPPKDFEKWARICEHIIRHYNEGWANGFHYNITYWEVWNEPDNNLGDLNNMWLGSVEEFCNLYVVTSKHLKNCFGDSIKIGGYAASGFYNIFVNPEKHSVKKPPEELPEWFADDRCEAMVDFLYTFLESCNKNNAPLDFFSWHNYARNPKFCIGMADFVDNMLKKYGYPNCESMINEWNNAPNFRASSIASSYAAAFMCAMHTTSVNIMCYYDARIGHSDWAGLFNPITKEPFCTYYPFLCFGEMYRMGTCTESITDTDNLYVFSAKGNGQKAVMAANINNYDLEITTNLDSDMCVYIIDEKNMYIKTNLNPKRFTLKAYQTAYIK